MTSFVHLNYSTQHPGLARVEVALGAVQNLRSGFPCANSLFAWPVSAVAALGTVASRLTGGLIRRIDGFSRHVAKARLDWAAPNTQMLSQSPRSE